MTGPWSDRPPARLKSPPPPPRSSVAPSLPCASGALRHEARRTQRILQDDSLARVENMLNIIRVGGAGHVRENVLPKGGLRFVLLHEFVLKVLHPSILVVLGPPLRSVILELAGVCKGVCDGGLCWWCVL